MAEAAPALTAVAVSHPGRVRDRNEDALTVCGWRAGSEVARIRLLGDGVRYAAVADGMGGHPAGDEASRLALQLLENDADRLDGASLPQVLTGMNLALHRYGQQHRHARGMGSTIAGLAVHRGTVLVFNVGDSAVFRLLDGYLGRLTEDDRPPRLPGQPDGVRTGRLSQCLGGSTGDPVPIRPHVHEVPLVHGDQFLLCSDGLTDVLDLDTVGQVLRRDPADAVPELLAAALEAGAPDNVSVAVVRIGEPGQLERRAR